LKRVDELLDTKRHGRFRDHGILDYAKREMEKSLGPVSYESLARLVNAAMAADGQDDPDGGFSGETIRKALDNLHERNKYWTL
jgi:hypothetical protein